MILMPIILVNGEAYGYKQDLYPYVEQLDFVKDNIRVSHWNIANEIDNATLQLKGAMHEFNNEKNSKYQIDRFRNYVLPLIRDQIGSPA
jgi:hypothetical protein